MARSRIPTLLAIILLASAAAAQEPPPAGPEAWGPADLTPEVLAAERERAAQTTPPEGAADAEKEAWRAAVEDRLAVIRNLEGVVGRSARLPTEQSLRDDEYQARLELRSLEGAGEREVEEDLTEAEFSAYEQELRDLRSRQQAAARVLADRKAELQKIETRITETQQQATQARQEASDLQLETGALAGFRLETSRMKLRRLGEELAYLGRLRELGPLIPPVRELQLQVATKKAELQEKFVARARSVPIRKFRQQAEDANRRAREMEGRIAQLPARLAQEDLDDAQRAFEQAVRTRELRLAAEAWFMRAAEARDRLFLLEKAKPLRDAQVERNELLSKAKERLESRYARDRGATSRSTDLLLANLDRVKEGRRSLDRTLQPDLDDLIRDHLVQRARTYDRLWLLESVQYEEPAELAELLDAVPVDRRADARERWVEASRELKAVLDERVLVLEEITSVLNKLDQEIYPARRDLLDTMEAFVVGHIYWVRSADPVGPEILRGIVDDLRSVARRYSSPGLWERLRVRLARTGWILLPVGGGFLAMLGLAFLIYRRLRDYRRRWKYRGGPVLVALQRLAAAVLLSALAPACLLLAAVFLEILAPPDEFRGPGIRAIVAFTVVLFARRFLWSVFREDGIATVDFRSPPEISRELLAFSRRGTAGLLFLVLPWWIASSPPLELQHVERVLFAVVLAFYALLLIGLIRPRGAYLRALTGGQGFAYRIWSLLSPLVLLGLLAIVAMDLLGYRYGSRLLAINVLNTFVAVQLLMGLYNLLISGVDRAIQKMRLRLWAEPGPKDHAEALTNALGQVSRLVGVVVVLAAVFLLADFWGISSGIRAFFRSIRIHRVTADPELWLTAWDLVTALAFLIAGHVLVRYLGGLLELAIFSRVEKPDPGTRYAVQTLARYSVFLVTYSSALLTLHISLASLGYIFAALSLGIGFGLQEIISNFVSGLILIFERPIRVGDVVSVGGLTGTVQAINIRATQLVDWDRQVIILPNRKFIVEEVVNWSHNDQVVRSTINVGVAYGTDPDKVSAVLLDILKKHPKVLAEPEPKVLFRNFGESSLDFVLRPFTLIEDKIPTLHEINREIAKRFAEEGIEIPFPQRDLHLRGVDEKILAATLAGREREAAEGE